MGHKDKVQGWGGLGFEDPGFGAYGSIDLA